MPGGQRRVVNDPHPVVKGCAPVSRTLARTHIVGMARSRFRNMQFPQGRIDTRPQSAETAAGVRNIHRDTDGSVIGGNNPDGTPFGSKVKRNLIDGSSLGNPVTKGLDRWRSMNPNAPIGQAAIDASRGNSSRTVAAPAGSDLLAKRQALHKDMKAAGQAGVTPEMAARAKELGVADTSFRRVAGEL
jgi:hypothetical protein